MAKFTPLYGNISGKLGANVFASGKGGSYIRTFRKPTNPNTLAQQGARADFSSASRGWANLSDAVKSAFNTFATSGFSPKKPKSGVQLSGFNVFTSMQKQCNACMRDSDDSLSITGDASPSLLEKLSYGIPAIVPSGVFSGSLSSDDIAGSFPLSIVSCTVDEGFSGGFDFTLHADFGGATVQPSDTFKFFDTQFGENFGIVAYISSPLKYAGQTPQSPEALMICSTRAIGGTFEAADIDTTGNIACSAGYKYNLDNSKFSWKAGDIVNVTFYAVSQSGCSALIGSLQKIIS